MNDEESKGGRGAEVGIAFAILAIVGLLAGGWYVKKKLDVAANTPAATTEPVDERTRPVTVVRPRAPGVVYEASLNSVEGEWSTGDISETPDGKAFIGPFHDQAVELVVDRLPAHRFVRVRFELITWERWDGDNAYFGRDSWDVRVKGGQPLVHTTFSNCGFFSDNNQQSFPDQFPWYPQHAAWTGAAEKQSHGWNDHVGASRPGHDSTYAFDLTFPHAGDVLALQFKSEICRHENKPFGFLSMKVETVEQAARGDEAVLKPLWDALADADSVAAYNAVWSMVATGDAATEFVKAKFAADMSGPATMGRRAGWGCARGMTIW